MSHFTGRLAFDGASRRMIVTDRSDENDDYEFHCGDCFEIKINHEWREVRIEHSHGWYLIGVPDGRPSDADIYIGSEVRL